jgi:hypothetical protein
VQAARNSFVSEAFRRSAWVSALSPTILLMVLVTFALHVRIGVGHWPTPMWEDYRTPLAARHEGLIELVLFFTLFAAPAIWLICSILNFKRESHAAKINQLFLYAAGWLLIVLAGTLDPTTFTAWLLD